MVNKLIGGVAFIALACGLIAIARPAQIVEKTIENQIVGATPTLDGVDHPFMKIAGLQTFQKRISVAATSSAPCTFDNSLIYRATSTVDNFTANLVNPFAAAITVDLGTSTSAFATSTPTQLVKNRSIAVGRDYINWIPLATTTNSAGLSEMVSITGDTKVILGPTDKLVLKIATGTPGATGSLTGTCSATIRPL